MTSFVTTEVRLSEVARGCERMSVLRVTGSAAEPPSPEARERFARGHLFERYVIAQAVHTFGEDDIERQVKIVHPLGVGHADAYIRSRKQIIEVKSSTSEDRFGKVFENAVRQVKLYVRYHPEAESGLVYMVNPSTLKPVEIYEVALTEEDVADIDATMERIAAGIADPVSELPPRVCTHPGQAISMFCPFAFDCFAGWERPEPFVVDDPAAVDVVERYAAAADEIAGHNRAIKALEPERDDAKAAVVAAVPEGESRVGPYLVKRSPNKGRKTFMFKAYEAAGIDDPIVEQFTAQSEGYDKVTVKDETPF